MKSRLLCLTLTKTFTISTLICEARTEFNRVASIAIPCSVNTHGDFTLPPGFLDEVANCDFIVFHSTLLSWKQNSFGKREPFLFTCSLMRFVSTWKMNARSLSSITCIPRKVNIRDSISDLIRFCSMKQTYFAELWMSRNGYAHICGGTTLFELRCLNFVVGTS